MPTARPLIIIQTENPTEYAVVDARKPGVRLTPYRATEAEAEADRLALLAGRAISPRPLR